MGSHRRKQPFHPDTTYFNASPAQRKKLIFPEWLDLSEAKGRGEEKRGRVEYDKEDVDRQYGATWFPDKVAGKTGVGEDLMKGTGRQSVEGRGDPDDGQFPLRGQSVLQPDVAMAEGGEDSHGHQYDAQGHHDADAVDNGAEPHGPVPVPGGKGRER